MALYWCCYARQHADKTKSTGETMKHSGLDFCLLISERRILKLAGQISYNSLYNICKQKLAFPLYLRLENLVLSTWNQPAMLTILAFYCSFYLSLLVLSLLFCYYAERTLAFLKEKSFPFVLSLCLDPKFTAETLPVGQAAKVNNVS